MNDFDFLDFTTCRGGSHQGNGERFMTVTRSCSESGHQTYRVGFSRSICEEIFKRQLTHFRIRKDNYTNALHIIFLKGDETMGKLYLDKASNLYRIANKRLVAFLAKRMGLTGYFRSEIIPLGDNLSNSVDYLTFELIFAS